LLNQTEGFLTVERQEKRDAQLAEYGANHRGLQARRVHEEFVVEANAREAALQAELAAAAKREHALDMLRGAVVDGGVEYADLWQNALDHLTATEKDLDRLRAELAATMEQVRGSPPNQEESEEKVRELRQTITNLTRENNKLKRYGIHLERHEDGDWMY
jgi:type II secretory pathway component PulM